MDTNNAIQAFIGGVFAVVTLILAYVIGIKKKIPFIAFLYGKEWDPTKVTDMEGYAKVVSLGLVAVAILLAVQAFLVFVDAISVVQWGVAGAFTILVCQLCMHYANRKFRKGST